MFERVLECIVSIALSALRLPPSVILFLETYEEVLVLLRSLGLGCLVSFQVTCY